MEWDAIYIIDYTCKAEHIRNHTKWLTNGTVVLLECKQNAWVDQLLHELPQRIQNTYDAVSSPIVSNKSKLIKIIQQKTSSFGVVPSSAPTGSDIDADCKVFCPCLCKVQLPGL